MTKYHVYAMGNRKSHFDQSMIGSEMCSTKEFISHSLNSESLCDMEELWADCLALKDGVQQLTEAIAELFLDNKDVHEGVAETEQKLQAIIKSNQAIVHKLTRNLEQHSKVVDEVQRNEHLMTIVKYLVSTVNSYMTMLIRNIRKLKSLISKMNHSSVESNFEQMDYFYDIISEHQDVDAMLEQLIDTEIHRQNMEESIIMVLVFWKDYQHLHMLADMEEHSASDADNNDVRIRAESVARRLMRLKHKK